MKNNSSSFMYKEIKEQPAVVKKLIRKHIDKKKMAVVFKEFAHHQDEIRKIGRVTLLGCGTSYHAATLGNYLLEELSGLPCEFELAEEFTARKIVVEKKTAVIILSQSGETADALTAAYKAKGKGALVIAITNKHGSTLEKTADLALNIGAGEEKSVAATKTFTAELMTVVLLALFFRQKRKSQSIRTKKILSEISGIPVKIGRVIKMEKKIAAIAKEYVNTRQMIVLGEKYNWPVALEGALKLKETVYLKAEGLELREFKHGPAAIIRKDFPVLLVAPYDSTFKDSLAAAGEIKKYGGKLLSITSTGGRRIEKFSDHILYLPKTMEILFPFLTVVALQLFVYFAAKAKGVNIDRPRHISKFVK